MLPGRILSARFCLLQGGFLRVDADHPPRRDFVQAARGGQGDEIKAWQSRSLDEVYPILYIDGLRLRIGDNGVITTKVAYLAIGVDLEGRDHALGCWIQDREGAKFWQKVVIDLRNRVVRVVLIACCDGLTGLPDAIRSIFPDTVVQT